MGLGAWSWGDRLLWNYGFGGFTDEDIFAAYQVSLDHGITLVDTAEAYGSGKSERLLGKFVQKDHRPVVVATKFMPYPWRLHHNTLLPALRRSLRRLGIKRIDLYQIHWPWPPVAVESWASALADAVEQGLVIAVGVTNYNRVQMLRTFEILEKRGVPLASNQVQYNLVNRRVEFNGLVKTCQEMGIALIAYSPLGKGALTGKYSQQHPPPGLRRIFYTRRRMRDIQPLLERMRQIGEAHGGKSLSAVALNWLMCKGAIPIPGAKTAQQAQDNCSALGWELTPQEVSILDETSAPIAV